MQFRQQPEDVTKDVNERSVHFINPLQWSRRDTEHEVSIRSLGEYFLPFFLAAMQSCWINGILIGLASLKFLGADTALAPFWGPPLVLIAAIFLFRRALQKEGSAPPENTAQEGESTPGLLALPGLRLMFVVLGLITVVLIWLRIYAASNFLFDPGWLLTFVGDMLSLNLHFYQALFIIAGVIYLCWHGMRLAQFSVEPAHVLRQLLLGLAILLFAILVRASRGNAGGNADDVTLLLLIPIFLYLALSTHALARITFIRRDHPVGLEGSITAQERAMLTIITIVGLVLLVITIIGGSFFSPAFFAGFQPVWRTVGAAYSGLTLGFSSLIAFILTPFYWLFNWLFSTFGYHPPQIRPPRTNAKAPTKLLQIDPASPGVVMTTKILLPVLIFLVLGLLIFLVLRKRKRVRMLLNRLGGDVHESIWSWGLFWGQFRMLLWSFFRRFFPKRADNATQTEQATEIVASPAARTIREIYRALLKKAATRGQIRKRDETPHEFQRRLDERDPQNEPQLGLLTEAYALTRYGGGVPNDYEVALARQSWNELERKWEAPL
ncbi:MAG TPA: DUF4129 domain-containing protein [Ktedonobacteraceae bacterium]|nr:DUF4129 domain-containing protein [Ktedonobacteraceae bacterium]